MHLKFAFLITLGCSLCLYFVLYAGQVPDGEVDTKIAEVIYSGKESLEYKVSWTGGIKIGEMRFEVRRTDDVSGQYEIHARVRDSGLFHFFYPVNDTFTTIVQGPDYLPLRYDVEQEEGRSYRAKRHTEYDQEQGVIRYRKNDQKEEVFQVTGKVHNEFSSFLATRLLTLSPENPVIVPTFADKKRHEVVVQTKSKIRINNPLLGSVNVIPVSPIMDFKGLYDKAGDTVIYLSDDSCRIPVRIQSKILIGSLTAELVSYVNPACTEEMRQYHIELKEQIPQQEKLELGD